MGSKVNKSPASITNSNNLQRQTSKKSSDYIHEDKTMQTINKLEQFYHNNETNQYQESRFSFLCNPYEKSICSLLMEQRKLHQYRNCLKQKSILIYNQQRLSLNLMENKFRNFQPFQAISEAGIDGNINGTLIQDRTTQQIYISYQCNCRQQLLEQVLFYANLENDLKQYFIELIHHNSSSLKLYYRIGLISLNMMNFHYLYQQIRWNEKQLLFIAYELLNTLIILKKNKLYYSDWKPSNIFFFLDQDPEQKSKLRMRLANFGFCSQSFNDIKAYTPCFSSINAKQYFEGTKRFQNEKERIRFDAFQIGRTIQACMMTAFYLNEDQKIKNKHQTLFSKKQHMKQFFDCIQKYYSDFLIQLVQTLLNESMDNEEYFENIELFKQQYEQEQIDIDHSIIIENAENINSQYIEENIIEIKDLNNLQQHQKTYQEFDVAYQTLLIVDRFLQLFQQKYSNTKSLSSSNTNPEMKKLIHQKYQAICDGLEAWCKIGNYQLGQQWYNQSNFLTDEELKSNNLADIALLLGHINQNINQLSNSEKFFKLAIDIRQSNNENINTSVAAAIDFNCLGLLYRQQNRVSEAESQFQHAIKIIQNSYDQNHLFMVVQLINLGELQSIQKKYDEAEKIFLQAIDIYANENGEQDEFLANQYKKLGDLYIQKNEYKNAQLKYITSLNIFLKLKGELTSEISEIYDILSYVYLKQGYDEKAEECYIKVIDIKIQLEGTQNKSVANLYGKLGQLYFRNHNYSKAEECFIKALQIIETIYGSVSLKMATQYTLLGLLYYQQKLFVQSEQQYNQAIKIKISLFGENHLSMIEDMSKLGNIYIQLGKYQLAESMYIKIIEIKQKEYGKDHGCLAQEYHNLAFIQYEQQNLEEAENNFMKSIMIKQQQYGDHHFSLISSYHILAKLYQQQDKEEEALYYYQQAIDIEQKEHGKTQLYKRLKNILKKYSISARSSLNQSSIQSTKNNTPTNRLAINQK